MFLKVFVGFCLGFPGPSDPFLHFSFQQVLYPKPYHKGNPRAQPRESPRILEKHLALIWPTELHITIWAFGSRHNLREHENIACPSVVIHESLSNTFELCIA